ncbi:Embryo-specific protein ATS3B, partial [Cucurbita argyrosperma subsp. sororia]
MESFKKATISLYFLLVLFGFSESSRSILPHPQSKPQPLQSFKINNTQNARSCSYTVTIKTSCGSPVYTRDQISIAFGDAYGNQVYIPRIDDPSSRAFERCSTDKYELNGPCTYPICYVYLYRRGYDGWVVDKVTIYSYSLRRSVTYNYRAMIPNDVWFGFNLCSGYHDEAVGSTAAM